MVHLAGERPIIAPVSLDGVQSDKTTTHPTLFGDQVFRDVNNSFQEALDSDTDTSNSEDDEAVEMEARNATESSTPPNRFLPEKSVELLKKWFYDHEANPYPNKDEKAILSKESKLAFSQVISASILLLLKLNLFDLVKQVETWFHHERRRQRKRKALISEGKLEKVITTFKRLPIKSVEVLQEWLEKHESDAPFVNKADAEALAAASGLTALQVVFKCVRSSLLASLIL